MEARDRLRGHIDGLFASAPQSRAAFELKEELLANSMDRYNDLLQQGMGEEEAMQNVIGSIGNVDELISALPDDEEGMRFDDTERRNRSALLTAVSVGLYIFAGVIFFIGIIIGEYLWEPFQLLVFPIVGLICIVPTCLLVYNARANPRYEKKDDTVVESFKQWNADDKRKKSVYGALSSVLWTFCTIVYFLLSFFTGAWQITWVIFLVAACLQGAVTLLFLLKGMGE